MWLKIASTFSSNSPGGYGSSGSLRSRTPRIVVRTPPWSRLPPPVQHELLVTCSSNFFALALTWTRSFSVSSGSGLVSRSKIASDSSVRSSRTLRCSSWVSSALMLDEPAEVLFDVEAAGVVGVDQLLEPLDQLDPGRVAPYGTRAVARCPSRAAARSVRAFGREPQGELLEVDLDRSTSGSALLGSRADDVLLGPDGAVEQLLDGVHDVGDVGRLTGGLELGGQRADHRDLAESAAAAGSGISALNSPDLPRDREVRPTGVLVDEQRLHGGVAAGR
jgi:hypothetical protein